MARKVLVFGNGLGMALDPAHFALANAIQYVWDEQHLLSDEEKQYIQQCLPSADNRPPEGEHELDILHLAVSACGFLKSLSGVEVEWLSEEGRSFPVTIEKFVHKVATKLHNYDERDLPEDFVNSLCGFLKETKSHVATLNYDRLLYEAMINSSVLDGFNYLVDGMWDAGFKKENLERLHSNDFGYYLHLHGSPLFYNTPGFIRKKRRQDLDINGDLIGRHLVLTHVKHKTSAINSSPVLSAYWDYLDEALMESGEIIIFGCGGEDEHLNQKLKLYSIHGRFVRIVEWSGTGEFEERKRFWKEQLGENITLVQLDNILDFTDW